MWADYWRQHGPYVIGSAAAHIASWGGVWLGDYWQMVLLAGMGVLAAIVSAIVLLIHTAIPLLIGCFVLLAGATVVVLVLTALAQLLHPALLVVLLLTAAAFGATYAGSWWGDHWRDLSQRLDTYRRRHGPTEPRTLTDALVHQARVRITRIDNPIAMRATPRRRRRCRGCGKWIEATHARCKNDECHGNP